MKLCPFVRSFKGGDNKRFPAAIKKLFPTSDRHSELIEISVGGKKYISQIRVDSEAEVSIFPRTVLINSLNPTSQLMVFRRSNDSPKKNIRLRFGDQVVASGVLKAKKEFSTLSRFDISIVATSLQTEFAELIVEESDDGENWREIGVVLCSSR